MLPNSNKLFEDFPSFGDSTANFRPWFTGFLYQPPKINHGNYLGHRSLASQEQMHVGVKRYVFCLVRIQVEIIFCRFVLNKPKQVLDVFPNFGK